MQSPLSKQNYIKTPKTESKTQTAKQQEAQQDRGRTLNAPSNPAFAQSPRLPIADRSTVVPAPNDGMVDEAGAAAGGAEEPDNSNGPSTSPCLLPMVELRGVSNAPPPMRVIMCSPPRAGKPARSPRLSNPLDSDPRGVSPGGGGGEVC
jgi:hypothetical protein